MFSSCVPASSALLASTTFSRLLKSASRVLLSSCAPVSSSCSMYVSTAALHGEGGGASHQRLSGEKGTESGEDYMVRGVVKATGRGECD